MEDYLANFNRMAYIIRLLPKFSSFFMVEKQQPIELKQTNYFFSFAMSDITNLKSTPESLCIYTRVIYRVQNVYREFSKTYGKV